MINEELAILIRAGVDVPENMAALYEQNKGMIAKLAGRFKAYAEFDDLMQEGYIGLCNAVDAWEPDGGACFISYAVYWMKQAMQRYIENCGSCVRVPVHQQQRIRKYKKLCAQYLKHLGREPADWELCRLLGVSRDVLHHIQEDVRKGQIGSLSAPLGEEGDLTLEDTIPDQRDDSAGVLDAVQQEELQAVLWPMVDSLGDQQALALRARYQEGKTLKETGELLGCNSSYAHVLEGKALRALRRSSYADQLRPFLYDDITRDRGMQGTGAKRFKETWTSATERVALEW